MHVFIGITARPMSSDHDASRSTPGSQRKYKHHIQTDPERPFPQPKKKKVDTGNRREPVQTVPEAELFRRVWPREYWRPNLIERKYVPYISSLEHHTA